MAESKNLWGGRFTGEADAGFVEFNRSFEFDRRLFDADVRASIAHCGGLRSAGVLTQAEADTITGALKEITERGSADANYFSDSSEDVHSFVEARLIELVGDVGRKLHTGRSRNDQVATDFRLWMRAELDQINAAVKGAQEALLELAETHAEAVVPGYTHLQRAQPVLFAHWCLAYLEMFVRDRERLGDVRKRVNRMPLGSAALAGTSYPIDREAVARELGFDEVTRNSIDAVSDRDFCVEFASACSLIMVHLSRLAEDIILYSTTEFGFLELSDAIATGSSLMPQKKNPDAMELVRGKAGRVFGANMSLLTMLKGLPLAYNKDMQEDKEAVFDAFDTVSSSLRVTATVFKNLDVNKDRARVASTGGYMNATEIADYLVRKGMPFRDAHEVVGKVVRRAIELGCELEQLSLTELQKFSTLFSEDVHIALSLDQTLKSKSLTGGTSPETVAAAIHRLRRLLDQSA